jgi:single-stranded DNA-binding protein
LVLLSGREEGAGGQGGYSKSSGSSAGGSASFDQRSPASGSDDYAHTEISDDDIPF